MYLFWIKKQKTSRMYRPKKQKEAATVTKHIIMKTNVHIAVYKTQESYNSAKNRLQR